MAFNITDGELAVLFRITTDGTAPLSDAQATTIRYLRAAAEAMILITAPGAPDAVHDGALVRLAGFMYDNDGETRITDMMGVSGARQMLAPWRTHAIGVIGTPADTPITPPGGGVLPPLPGDGTFILQTIDGVLTWVKFPAPPQPGGPQ